VTGPGRTMPEAVVLDAYAVLAFLDDEPGAVAVAEVLRSGEPWMTLVNLGEVMYIVERERGVEAADEVWANLRAQERPGAGQSIRWLDVDEVLVRAAAKIKAGGGISYADSFAAAAAGILGCPVLTGDPEFAVVEAAGIVVHWLPPPG